MEARLPVDKLTRIYHTVANWLDKRNATGRKIPSLVGLLQHAAKVVYPGRIFVCRMYNVTARWTTTHDSAKTFTQIYIGCTHS